MNDIFKIKNMEHNFRNNFLFATRNVKFVHYGSETVYYLGPKIWKLLCKNIKDSDNINIFKSNVNLWKPENCPFCMCKIYFTQS